MARPAAEASRDDLARRYLRVAEQEFRGASPLYERLAHGVATDSELLARLAEAPPEGRRPILLFAAVQSLLFDHPAEPLSAFYPSITPGAAPAAGAYPAFHAFCLTHWSDLLHLLRTRRVQTNEVRRCAGWLPAFALVSRLTGGRPLALVEVGASAGLNLLFDHYAYDYGAGRVVGDAGVGLYLTCMVRGPLAPPLPVVMPSIAGRVGIDLAPIDVRDPDATRWLRACIWPEQRDRAARLDRALEIARRDPMTLVAGDALDALPRVIAAIPREVPICLFHSATLAYFPREARAHFADLVAALAAGRDLFWLSSEGPGPLHDVVVERAEDWRRRDEAARAVGQPGLLAHHWIVLTTFPGGTRQERLLAAIDSHGAWLEWLHDGPAGDDAPLRGSLGLIE